MEKELSKKEIWKMIEDIEARVKRQIQRGERQYPRCWVCGFVENQSIYSSSANSNWWTNWICADCFWKGKDRPKQPNMSSKIINKLNLNDTDMKTLDWQLTQEYKLKEPCQDCEKEKSGYYISRIYNFCFEHRWNNPYKLNKEKKELEKELKSSKFDDCIVLTWLFLLFTYITVYTFMSSLNKDTSLWMVPIVVVFVWLPLWYLWGVLFRKFKSNNKEQMEELKEIKKQLNQWIRIK